MTEKRVAREDWKLVKCRDNHVVEVPEDAVVGENCDLGWADTFRVGTGFRIGDGIALSVYDVVGNNVHIGNDSKLDNVVIGSNSSVGQRVRLANVQIGDNVTIEGNVRIMPGVIVSDNWYVLARYILNPGPDDAPVPLAPSPTFRCNVRGSLTADSGGRYY